jgi:hypothetical protein
LTGYKKCLYFAQMIALVRKAFWFAFFVAATISFVVLFEHGTVDFQNNFKAEVNGFIKLMHNPPKKAADTSDSTQ